MVETTQKKWYVLHTYSGYEDKVKSDLLSRAQSMGMQDYIFRVMVPEEEKVDEEGLDAIVRAVVETMLAAKKLDK